MVIHSGYRDQVADEELTIGAKVVGKFIYEANSALVEIDPAKVFQGNKVYAMPSHPPDRALLRERFDSRFGGLVPLEMLEPLRAEYFPGTAAPPTAAPTPSSAAPPGDGPALHANLSARIFLCTLPTAAKSKGFRFCNP